MFRYLNRKLKTLVLGELVHTYDTIEVTHGSATCSDRFEIRCRKGAFKLFHERVWQDPHDLKKTYHEYTAEEVAALHAVFTDALERVPLKQSHDFGTILEMRDGRMRSREIFSVEASGGEHYLFRRAESSSYGSSNTTTTYFPLEEISCINDVLSDALGRITDG